MKKPLCKMFSLGKCKYGEKCKFVHLAGPGKATTNLPRRPSTSTCSYCGKTGHTARRCVGKFLAETPKETPPRESARPTALVAAVEDSDKNGDKNNDSEALPDAEYAF